MEDEKTKKARPDLDDGELSRVAGGTGEDEPGARCPTCGNVVPKSAFTGSCSFTCPTCGTQVDKGLILSGEAAV